MYFLKLPSLFLNIKYAIVRQIWNFDQHEFQRPVSDCPTCGKRFEPDQTVLNCISQMTQQANHISEKLNCLDLPAEVWNSEGLMSGCPYCGEILKFSPYISGLNACISGESLKSEGRDKAEKNIVLKKHKTGLEKETLINEIINKTDHILITHAHYDHLLDVPVIARQTGAQVFGSANVCSLLQVLQVPSAQLHELHAFDEIELPYAHARVIPASHPFILREHRQGQLPASCLPPYGQSQTPPHCPPSPRAAGQSPLAGAGSYRLPGHTRRCALPAAAAAPAPWQPGPITRRDGRLPSRHARQGCPAVPPG